MERTAFLNDPELVEILGAFIGDGWIEQRGTAFYITGSPTEDKDYYDHFLVPLISKRLSPVTPKSFPYWGVYGVAIYRRSVIKFLLNNGFSSGKKALTAAIPDEIMISEDKEVIAAVLRGIFDTDGCFYCKKAYGKNNAEWRRSHHVEARILFTTVSSRLSEQMSVLLRKLNITHRSARREGGFRSNRNNAAIYSIRIDKRESLERWFTIVGTHNPRHETRYAVWKALGHLPPHTTIAERRQLLAAEI